MCAGIFFGAGVVNLTEIVPSPATPALAEATLT